MALYKSVNYHYYCYYFLKAHQHKATGRKKLGWTYKIMVATAIYSVTMVLWKKPHIRFAEPWKGVGKRMLSPGCLL